MKTGELIPICVRKIALTNVYCAVIVGNNEAEFAIYIEPQIGAVMKMFIEDIDKMRPLTHDLIGHILTGLDATVEKVVINDLRDNTYFARLFISTHNGDSKHIVEIDGRPSDCIAIALLKGADIYVTRAVFEAVARPEEESEF